MRTITTLLLLAALTSSGCYYDKEEDLYPPPAACDPGTVTYSGTVSALISNYGCAGCHGASAPSGNITLTNYNGVQAAAASGRLYGAISHASGFAAMPQGGARMNACDIARVKAWIDAGTPNN